MDAENWLYRNQLQAVYLPLRFHRRIPLHQEFQNTRVGARAAPIQTLFAYDLDHAHTRTHTHNHAYFPPMLIDFALRLDFSAEACPTRPYNNAYGVPANFQGVFAGSTRRMFRKVAPRRPIHPKFTSERRGFAE